MLSKCTGSGLTLPSDSGSSFLHRQCSPLNRGHPSIFSCVTLIISIQLRCVPHIWFIRFVLFKIDRSAKSIGTYLTFCGIPTSLLLANMHVYVKNEKFPAAWITEWHMTARAVTGKISLSVIFLYITFVYIVYLFCYKLISQNWAQIYFICILKLG